MLNSIRVVDATHATIPGGFGGSRARGWGVKLTLPYPPSSNRYWRHARGFTYLSKEAKQYRADVQLIGIRCKPLAGPVRMTVQVYRPRKAGDLMNREKVLSDALQGVAFENDSQIREAHFFLFDDKKNPRVEVEVTEIAA